MLKTISLAILILASLTVTGCGGGEDPSDITEPVAYSAPMESVDRGDAMREASTIQLAQDANAQ